MAEVAIGVFEIAAVAELLEFVAIVVVATDVCLGEVDNPSNGIGIGGITTNDSDCFVKKWWTATGNER
jgi:hypothetical protein